MRYPYGLSYIGIMYNDISLCTTNEPAEPAQRLKTWFETEYIYNIYIDNIQYNKMPVTTLFHPKSIAVGHFGIVMR